MSHIVVGTAGHIDHGKTTLVKALTGIDTDRLKEEKERGITIELGFAHLKLPSGKTVALVDVPGHEKFIRNMLAGAAGIDLALLVIAADEGVMPQTREHLDILRLLEINRLIVAINKIDLVDEDLVSLVEEDVKALLLNTGYQDAPLVRVSAKSGAGVHELLAVLDSTIEKMKGLSRGGRTRLPIDRVFTMPGFGTVVTGTLFNGEISQGTTLEIATKDLKVRVRSLQVHQHTVQKVLAGQRVAVNLSGVEFKDLGRGDVLTEIGWIRPTSRVDLSFTYLPHFEKEINSWTRVRFHQGTKETMGRLVFLQRDTLAPGEEAFAQLVLEEPVVVLRGDNYILRSYSPAHTIGGGRIIEPHAVRHKSKEEGLLNELKIKASGDLGAIIQLLAYKRKGLITLAEVLQESGEQASALQPVIMELIRQGKLREIKTADQSSSFIATVVLAGWEKDLKAEIGRHLAENPLEPGLNKEEARARLWPKLSIKDYNTLLTNWVQEKKIAIIEGQYLAPAGYETRVDSALAQRLSRVQEIYRNYHWQVPSWEKVKLELGLDNKAATQLLQYLVRREKLVPLGDDLYLPIELLAEGKEKLRSFLLDHGELTVAQARDYLGTTRKITVPLLEYLDRTKFTARAGDVRKLING